MKYPNQDNLIYGIVCGGDDKDPAPNQDGGFRVFLPTQYSNNVKRENLPFVRMLVPPTMGGGSQFNAPPERGTAVLCQKIQGQSGTGHLIVMGILPDVYKDQSIPGNLNLAKHFTVIDESLKHKIDVNIPPNIKETLVNGAKVRQVVEKNIQYSHDLTKGIPSHGALYPLSGTVLPTIRNVSTAIQDFNSILTANALNSLPGISLTLGGFFTQIPSILLDRLYAELPVDVGYALETISTLIQDIETIEEGGFIIGGRINPDIFFTRAVDVLLTSGNVSSLVYNLQRLQYDDTLYGLDLLEEVVNTIDTSFGQIIQRIDYLGRVITEIPEQTQLAINSFNSLLQNPETAPSVEQNKQMFGSSSSVMSEMFGRLPNEKQTFAKQMMEDVVAAGTEASAALESLVKKVNTSQNIG